MTKKDFLQKLRSSLKGIPNGDIEERISFYSEIIDDRIEDGIAEDVAVAELGTIDSIVSQITAETPLSKLIKEKVKPNRKLKTWEVVLLVVGSPIWFSLAVALVAIIFSLFVVIWSLIIALWAVEFAFAACSIAGVFNIFVAFLQGNVVSGIAVIGLELVCIGFTVFCFYGCKYSAKGILALLKQLFLGLKSCFVKKGVENE